MDEDRPISQEDVDALFAKELEVSSLIEAEEKRQRPGRVRRLLQAAATAVQRLVAFVSLLFGQLVVAIKERDLARAERDLAQAARDEALRAKRKPERRHLDNERSGLVRKFKLTHPARPHVCPLCKGCYEDPPEEVKVYFDVGLYPEGCPGEIFATVDRSGSMARGAFDAVAIAVSIGLQYGVPMRVFLDKFENMRFGLGGYTGDKEFPKCSSVLDLMAKWLRKKFSAFLDV